MKILIVVGSLLGKTMHKAQIIGHYLEKQTHRVYLVNASEAKPAMCKAVDLVIFACSTWDDGILQYDFRKFNDELLKINLPNQRFAILTLGSENYPHPFGAATILEKTVEQLEGNLVASTLKLDIDHDEPTDKFDKEALEWIDTIHSNFATN